MSGETAGDAVIRIVLADGHTLFREGIRAILQVEQGLAVVGEAGDPALAVRIVKETQPDVALLDGGLGFPDANVAQTARELLGAVPELRVIVVSMCDEPSVVRELLAAGVRGYLLKTATRYDLIAAVRSVVADDQRVVLSVSRTSITGVHAPSPVPGLLTAREREVMALVSQGLTNGQAARQLSIAEGTVKHHLRNIFAKLGATSRVDAVNKAIASSVVDGSGAPRR